MDPERERALDELARCFARAALRRVMADKGMPAHGWHRAQAGHLDKQQEPHNVNAQSARASRSR